MTTKPMTREQMKRAALLVEDYDTDATPDEMLSWCLIQPSGCCCASMLLSEAHRPAGHDGDWTDEL